MKPILFNADMVRAILEGRKTVTRRVVKLKYSNTHMEMFTNKYGTRLIEKQNEEPGVTTIKNPDGTTTHTLLDCIEKAPPCRPGDILYVRETWRVQSARRFDADARIMFKAGGDMARIQFPGGGTQYHSRTKYDAFVRKWADDRWHPSIHMPREAARIFLRVTDVRVERLQEMPPYDIAFEGFRKQKDFIALWNSTIKPSDRAIYGWDANPWVWVIEFERCEMPKGA